MDYLLFPRFPDFSRIFLDSLSPFVDHRRRVWKPARPPTCPPRLACSSPSLLWWLHVRRLSPFWQPAPPFFCVTFTLSLSLSSNTFPPLTTAFLRSLEWVLWSRSKFFHFGLVIGVLFCGILPVSEVFVCAIGRLFAGLACRGVVLGAIW